MNYRLRMTATCALSLATLNGAYATSVNNTWNTTAYPGANTPLTAYDWSSPEHWKNPTDGVPSNYGDMSHIGNCAGYPRWISLGAGLKVSCFNAEGTTLRPSAGNFYIGDLWVGAIPGVVRGTMGVQSSSYIFGNVYATGYHESFGYMNGQIAGRFSGAEKDVPGVTQASSWAIVSDTPSVGLSIRCDMFADDANPVRVNPIDMTGYSCSQGSFFFYGPKGAEAQDASWELTAGSPYLQYAGSGTHGIVPGSVVTGPGVAPNTFVRYVFASTGWIALSNPIAADVSGVKALHFGAITPSVETVFSHVTINANAQVAACKYREQDGCKLTLQAVNVGDKYTQLGVADASFIPGDMVVDAFRPSANPLHYVDLLNVRLTFEDSYATPQYPFFKLDAGKTARMTVLSGVETTLSTFKDLNGMIDKRGAGALTLNLATAVSAGTVKVSEGRLVLSTDASLGAAELSVAKVDIAAGATLKIPAEGMCVSDELTVGEGATIEGPGRMKIPRNLTASVKLTGGVTVICPSEADLVDANHPWFDLDATDFGTAKMETIVENGTNFVTKWYDSCGNGQFVKRRNMAPVGDGSYPDGSGYCWVRENLFNGMPYVDMGPFYCNNRNVDGRLYGPDRSLAFCLADGTTFKMGNDYTPGEARPNLTAAFFAVGSENGGGTLLGAGGGDYGTFGLVHGYGDGYREQYAPIWCHQDADYDTWQLRSFFTDAALESGTAIFRVNGTTCQPAKTAFSGGFDVMTVKAPADKPNRLNGGCIGYFGQYTTWDAYEQNCGGLQLGEVLLLTNDVSTAQINDIEAYLRYKWRGDKTPGMHTVVKSFQLMDGATYATQVVVAEEAGGSGTLEGDFELTGDVFEIACDANGTFPSAFAVTGKATVASDVVVKIDASAARKLIPGTYTIFSAENIVCHSFNWKVEGPQNRSYKLVRDGNEIKLIVSQNGFVLGVR